MTTDSDQRPIVGALDALATLARVHDRPDLDEAAAGAIARLRSTRLRVVVLGEFKKGKSSLINALLDAPIAAVDDDIATAARLEIVHCDEPRARRWRREVSDGDESTTVASDLPIAEAGPASTDASTVLVRAGLPRRLLRPGLTLVDTPGVGGVGSAEAVVTASSLADAHVALFVTDCTQELTAGELAAIRDAVDRGPHVVVVETKTDISPHWRTIVEADRGHLTAAGLDIPVIPVSNALRLRALRRDDRGLNDESGFPPLVTMLTKRFLPEATAFAETAALRTARRVYRLLHEPLATELQALDAAASDVDATAVVDDAKARIADFKALAAKWQQVLNDGWTDVVSAVDHDLRDGFRTIVRDCDDEVADVDPDEVWSTFEPALYRRTAEVLDANLSLLRERSADLARRVAEHLDDALPAADDLLADSWSDDDRPDGSADRKEGTDTSAGARAQQAFRAGYGGAMPIMAVGGMALGVLGLGTLVLPLAAVAGVVAGRKALTDERERRLNQRRQQARVAVKRYTDDVLLRAGNERKATQRRIQRTLRDHFTERVKELALSHGAALRAAEEAVAASDEQRRARFAEVRSELERIERVAFDLQAAMSSPAPSPHARARNADMAQPTAVAG